MTRPRGLSLLEVLITMVLVAVAMAMVATLVRNFSRVNNHLAGKERTLQGFLMLQAVASEVEGAARLTAPTMASPGPVTDLTFEVYASTPDRLTVGTNVASWSPDYVIAVRYFQEDDRLMRQLTFPDGASQTSQVATGLSGFSATYLNSRTVEVRASFQEAVKLETVSAQAFRWGD